MTDDEIEDLIRRRDAGDEQADEILTAWIERCLGANCATPPSGSEAGEAARGDAARSEVARGSVARREAPQADDAPSERASAVKGMSWGALLRGGRRRAKP